MGAVGDALDNALAESFVASQQREHLDRRTSPARACLIRTMFHSIDAFHNPDRPHSTLDQPSPVELEATAVA